MVKPEQGQIQQQDKYILAIDQGTTSTRALVFDIRGEIVAHAQKDLAVETPKSGWVQQDAWDIWQDTIAVCQQVTQDFKEEISCIGITNQRETTIIWDKETGRPVSEAIVWQDRRTSDVCQRLKSEGAEGRVTNTTGLLLDPYFSATKINWILGQNPEWRMRAEKGELLFGTVETYLIWHLSGGTIHKTDTSNAARTALMDIKTQQWSPEMLSLFDIPALMLPDICENTDLFTNVLIDEIPALKNVPIHGCAGDQQAALFGQACFDAGMIKSTYGTGCFALLNTGATCPVSSHKLLSTVAWKINGQTTYALEGSIFVAGAAIQFLRDQFNFFDKASDTDALAESVKDTEGVYFVPALTGLGAPYWEAEARGAIFGLSRGTTKAHIVRAVLDAQCYQTQDLLKAMAGDAEQDIKEIRVDGGLTDNQYMMQRLADITGVVIRQPSNIEATAWGAAALAGLGFGLYKDLNDIKSLWQQKQAFQTGENQTEYAQAYQKWCDYVQRVIP